MILIDDIALCSGCLINNTSYDFTPYFLTANHCVAGEDVGDWSFRFQYKSPTCNGEDGYSYYSYSGADLKTNSSVSDFALLELNDKPSATIGVTYAGWSRSPIAPNSSIGIHHPSGDVMKISHSNSQAVATNVDGIKIWRLQFDSGVVESGSSGSPLFDNNHRIVGQLLGTYRDAPISCINQDGYTLYGRFDISWNSGLSQFLDPNNTGAMTMNTTKHHIFLDFAVFANQVKHILYKTVFLIIQ